MQILDMTLEKNNTNIEQLLKKFMVNKSEMRRFKIRRSCYGGLKVYVKN